ncbi:TRAUB-domain-containing protein [Punctularia strigosozonata HHB-11173 SS5]|uniref:TRAUB-domain-containing protein n=1 Tax=Punctularia strigosozonata (strain HHB-11173) TaxID=741275 RepID=UPI000441763F|nr:TRAUB-domain-containing protein [Punctularia strigosozonata HHB-11173 SS5]EIN06149.1 TRAUB-domain-containing protein [Punctularia strigosozonata HHB-11173 SS5]
MWVRGYIDGPTASVPCPPQSITRCVLRKPAGLTLAQQVAQLAEATPLDFDPEDAEAQNHPADEEDDGPPQAHLNAARAHYVDVGPSALRRARESVADPKYAGARTSRARLMDTADSPSEDEDEDEETHPRYGDDSGSPAATDEEGHMHSDDEISSAAETDEDQDDDDGHEALSPTHRAGSPHPHQHAASNQAPALPAPQPDALSTALRQKREEDVKKGAAVSRQLGMVHDAEPRDAQAIFDALLDARIRLQKTVSASNSLPRTIDLTQHASAIQRTLDTALALSDELASLHEILLEKSNDAPSVPLPPRKRRRLTEDARALDHPQSVHDASLDLFAFEHAYHPHLLRTLAKWSSKISAATPAPPSTTRTAFSARPSSSSAFSAFAAAAFSASAQIDAALAAPRARSQRNPANDGGGDEAQPEEGEGDDDTFDDDTAFYQQLLRDVIASRTGYDAAAGAGAWGAEEESWRAVQRQKAQKKKASSKSVVDTKASKGRKLRFEVHEKLQNFMVPVPVPGAWHEAQVDELFASVLGKAAAVAAPAEEEEAVAVDGGFRLFG